MATPERQLTVRAIATGFLLGALLAPCNIYTGLKIGFSFNMSIAAALLSYAFWNGLHRFGATPRWGLLENNINQTAASSAASILSAGLVAPIPALTLITGRELAFPVLAAWVFAVSFAGVVCALAVRRQMLERDALPFPNGVATAETITEIYAHGQEAARRIRYLLGAGLVAGAVKLVDSFVTKLPSVGLPDKLGFTRGGGEHVSWRALGMELQPSLLLFGFGAIVGPRVGWSLLLGTVVGWMILPPELLARQWAFAPESGGWYGALYEWLMWPGVCLMVAAALMSFVISMARLAFGQKAPALVEDVRLPEVTPAETRHFPRSWFWGGALVSFVLVVTAQRAIFDIPLWMAAAAFVLSFILAIVAGRVSGETGIPPIGALGKITQVTFGALCGLSPNLAASNTTINLMAANVTGGAAGQCSDMLHDLKTGKLIGASLRGQVIAQVFGVLAGSLAGCAAYLVLIPDPQSMLLTEEWPAPAVAAWKAVAEVLAEGFDSLPAGTEGAMLWAGLIGIVLAVLEALVSERRRLWIPSASSLGFALIIPPYISLAIFLGSMLRVASEKLFPAWSAKYIIVIAAGLVAGESLAGVIDALSLFLGLK